MLVQARLARHTQYPLDGRAWAECQARQMYHRLCNQARWSRLWSALVGRTHRLLDLALVEADCTLLDRHSAETRTVSVDRIRGSQGRCDDFDRRFCPLQEHTRERWLNIAKARQQGRLLPPVELVQVGDIYFCTDGHHRISVARALGERQIRANVVVWTGDIPPLHHGGI